ncbi:hypothetical protein YQ22_03665 [Maribacter sp. 1_2014MBL_MicDiv]|nr:hypothetical protein YQ22_03665 [Maribacter sp. 1_2014MBL_MicDiv]
MTVATKAAIINMVKIIVIASFFGNFIKKSVMINAKRGIQGGNLVTVDQKASYCSIPRLLR